MSFSSQDEIMEISSSPSSLGMIRQSHLRQFLDKMYMGRSMETHPLFWKSVFLADFFSVSGGWAMKTGVK